jgi:intracellular sulfur oxidation DsrE/DsrF family protein
MSKNTVKYSVIVLLDEQHEDFAQFVQNLFDLFSNREEIFEILIVANGTGGFLRNTLRQFKNYNEKVKAFELNTQVPQAVCLKAALKESNGKIIVLCGPYQQLSNSAHALLLDSLDAKTDILSAWRQKRVDPYLNQLQSRVFNTLVGWITGSDLHDLNCTVRILRREVIEETELYGNMYRFLPILAEKKGFKTREVKCEHYQERGKTGFYSLSSYITRLIDIFTLYFNTRFTRKPLRLFGSIGLGFFLVGLSITSYIFLQRIFTGHPMGGSSILLLAIFFMVLGVQAASVGLLGEIIAFTHGRQRKEYTVEKVI